MSYVRKFSLPGELRKFVKSLDGDEDMCKVCQRCHFAPAMVAKIALDALAAWELENKPARNGEVSWLNALYALKDARG